MNRILSEKEYQELLDKKVYVSIYMSDTDTVAQTTISYPYDTNEDVINILATFKNDMNASFDKRHYELIWIEKLYKKIPNWIKWMYS